MAEYLFKDYVNKKGVSDLFCIKSSATSTEEIGNSIHYGTKKILDQLGIDSKAHRARQITQQMFDEFDFIICMDENNIRNLKWSIRNIDYKKVFKLLDFCGLNRSIADPWYTGNFDATYSDIKQGIEAFYNYLVTNGYIKL